MLRQAQHNAQPPPTPPPSGIFDERASMPGFWQFTFGCYNIVI